MSAYCYVNGEILPKDKGTVGITDLALQRGYGVFDFGRSYNGMLFHFADNIARLRQSAAELHLDVPLGDQEITAIAQQLIDLSDLTTPAIRLLLTGGCSSLDTRQPNLIMIAEELPTYPEVYFSQGAALMSIEYQRELPQVKSINYLNSIRLEQKKRQHNALDLLYYNRQSITESPRSNFFAFCGDTLITPAEDILYGITRKIVLQLATAEFHIEERDMPLEELASIDEAFLTSTSKNVLPVSTIDNKPIGTGSVGKNTQKLMAVFQEYLENYS
ncbi:aminotransferase class IV [Porticoccus sp. W117]|uniref:aminotransferase class IV n=1 Tax=Porticoccus sp. W117 TaxID=3054777 RepID=UPI00259309B3|nr:aminotransferase class IV [Porticoccus sp. W117]MDM3872314.1 aminotransferase class IV [Porticoccus sp. W117]